VVAPPDAAAATTCRVDPDCPPGEFCGGASGRCIADVAQVAAGAHHTCALHQDGTVSCWGLGESIAGGGASVVGPRVVPVTGARALSAGTHQTCAVTDGGVQCWGNRAFEVVKEDGRSPLAGASAVAVGPSFGCALAPDGVHCWGRNEMGQLGRPLDLTDSFTALLAAPGPQRLLGAGQAVVAHDGGERLCAWGSNASKQVVDDDVNTVYPAPRCGAFPDVAQLAVGADHVCVRRAAGAIACWGERYYGQLGIGGTADETLDVAPPGADTRLAGPVATLAAGVSHTCALLADGQVLCFGRNHRGQVGIASAEEEVRTPSVVQGLAGTVRSIWSGSSAHHTCAVLASGAVACWGANGDGQLGDGASGRDAGRFSREPRLVRW
jgi:alpha-tubulin suppressor-like RCC1 family protein